MEEKIQYEMKPNITIEPISEKEVYDNIKHLKSERSPGTEGITNEALKLGAI